MKKIVIEIENNDNQMKINVIREPEMTSSETIAILEIVKLQFANAMANPSSKIVLDKSDKG